MDYRKRYIQTILIQQQQDIYEQSAVFKQFLQFMPHVVDYSYEEQLQLFYHAKQSKVFFSQTEWQSHGRKIIPSELPIRLYNFETDSYKEVYALEQTQGVPFDMAYVPKAFSDEVKERAKKDLAQTTKKHKQHWFKERIANVFLNEYVAHKQQEDTIDLPDLKTNEERVKFGMSLLHMARQVKQSVVKVFNRIKQRLLKQHANKRQEDSHYVKTHDKRHPDDFTRGITPLDRRSEEPPENAMAIISEGIRRGQSIRHVGNACAIKLCDELAKTGGRTLTQTSRPLNEPIARVHEKEQTSVVSESTDYRQHDAIDTHANQKDNGIVSDISKRYVGYGINRLNASGVDRYSQTVHLNNNLSDKVNTTENQKTTIVVFDDNKWLNQYNEQTLDEWVGYNIPAILPANYEQHALFSGLYDKLQQLLPNFLLNDNLRHVSFPLDNGHHMTVTKLSNGYMQMAEQYPKLNDTAVNHQIIEGVFDNEQGIFVPTYQYSNSDHSYNALPQHSVLLDKQIPVSIALQQLSYNTWLMGTIMMYNTWYDELLQQHANSHYHTQLQLLNKVYPYYEIVQVTKTNQTVIHTFSQLDDALTLYHTLQTAQEDNRFDLVKHISTTQHQLLASNGYMMDYSLKDKAKDIPLKQLPFLNFGTLVSFNDVLFSVDSVNVPENFVYLAKENNGYYVKKYPLSEVAKSYDNNSNTLVSVQQDTQKKQVTHKQAKKIEKVDKVEKVEKTKHTTIVAFDDSVTPVDNVSHSHIESNTTQQQLNLLDYFIDDSALYNVIDEHGNTVSYNHSVEPVRTVDTVINEPVINQELHSNTKKTTIVAFDDVSQSSEPSKTIMPLDHIQYANGKKSKFNNNIKAIQLLKELETSGRQVTMDDVAILEQYAGFGGLSEAFDMTNDKWQKEYTQLQTLLTKEEYRSAKASILTAYYTDTKLIEAIYQALDSLPNGTFQSIIDPATGTGNFMRHIPKHWDVKQKVAVELDDLSARLATYILSYKQVDVKHMGYEDTQFKDKSFDLAIGNIPFNDIKVYDKRYNAHHFVVHDYFMAKTIDLLTENGLMVFITSSGTMDKKDTTFREYLATRADLVGAIRLPNNAFLQTAHTSVVSDILIFRKHTTPNNPQIEWIDTIQQEQLDNIAINRYFVNHPEHVLGDFSVKSFRGKTLDVTPNNSKPLHEQVYRVMRDIIQTRLREYTIDSQVDIRQPIDKGNAKSIANNDNHLDTDKRQKAVDIMVNHDGKERSEETENDINVLFNRDTKDKRYSYFIKDGTVYYVRVNALDEDIIETIGSTGKKVERLKGMIHIKQQVETMIQLQLHDDYSDNDLKQLRIQLNHMYDYYVKTHGYLNEPSNATVFSDDEKSALLLAIEKVKTTPLGTEYMKSDIFYQATVRQKQVIDHVDTAKEALSVSLVKKATVDLTYMSQLLHHIPEDEIIEQLKGEIYLDPTVLNTTKEYYRSFVSASEYLSGNVRFKLKIAETIQQSDFYDSNIQQHMRDNIQALSSVLPSDIPAEEIGFQLSSRWIPQQYIREFMVELFDPPAYALQNIALQFSKYGSEYKITGKSQDNYNPIVTNDYGTKRMNGYQILEKALNMQDVTIKDKIIDDYGNGKSVINAEETLAAREKKVLIEQAFSNWLFSDDKRKKELVSIYNQQFNSYVIRQYNGDDLTFDGMNLSYQLREHQKRVVARILYDGRALMAHEVGAGKTAAMITAGKYMKDIGLIHKPLYVVPNPLKVQWAKEFYEFYPNANVLLVTEKDFKKENRKQFLSRIATGNYDAVVMGESQFTMVSLSKERQEQFITDEINELEEFLETERNEQANDNNRRLSIKNIQRQLQSLKLKLQKLSDKTHAEDILTFEALGVDFLFVDEAHRFKNLGVTTRLSNVAGVSTTPSQKAQDMFMKVRYMQEKYNGRGVVFATGTPISNSMTEMYTMQRYLQPEMLEDMHISLFDEWVGTFGKVEANIEINPEGEGYRIRQRLKKFENLPELVTSFTSVADIVTSDMMDLKIPKMVTGKPIIVVSEKSDYQIEIMEKLSDRATLVRNRAVNPKVDNMLKITNDGKLLAIDPRLLDSSIPQDAESKISKASANIYHLWKKHTDTKATQIVFSDSGVPGSQKAFNVYDDIKIQLINYGIPSEEIAFVHDAKTDKQRDALFEKVRAGSVRIIIGSTDKLGTGVNVQDKLIAAHHIDCPWKPSDVTQRDGRILRQGNTNDEVYVYRYITKGTFDSYLWQIQEQKLTYINQIMTGKTINRSGDDLDESVLSAAEVKALATGNPAIAHKMQVDNDVTRLQLLKKQWAATQAQYRQNIETYPDKIDVLNMQIASIEKDMQTLEQHPMVKYADNFSVEINGVHYGNDKKKEANEALSALYKQLPHNTSLQDIGYFRGMTLYASRETSQLLGALTDIKLSVKGERYYSVVLDSDNTTTGLLKLNNRLHRIDNQLEQHKESLKQIQVNFDKEKERVQDEFPQEAELTQLLKEQSALATEIELGHQNKKAIDNSPVEEVSAEEDMSNEWIKGNKETENTTIVAFDEKTEAINNASDNTVIIAHPQRQVEHFVNSPEFKYNHLVLSKEDIREFTEQTRDLSESQFFRAFYLFQQEIITDRLSHSQNSNHLLSEFKKYQQKTITDTLKQLSLYSSVYFTKGEFGYIVMRYEEEQLDDVYDIFVIHLGYHKYIRHVFAPSLTIATDYLKECIQWDSELFKQFIIAEDFKFEDRAVQQLEKLTGATNDIAISNEVLYQTITDLNHKLEHNQDISLSYAINRFVLEREEQLKKWDKQDELSSSYYKIWQRNTIDKVYFNTSNPIIPFINDKKYYIYDNGIHGVICESESGDMKKMYANKEACIEELSNYLTDSTLLPFDKENTDSVSMGQQASQQIQRGQDHYL